MSRPLKPLDITKQAGQISYNGIDPLDGRYFDQETSRYLSERSRVLYQAFVEAALAQTLADFGICSRKSANEIEKAAREIKIEAVYKEEQKTKHDIKALANCIKAKVSSTAQPYVHFGATSYDIIATAQALQLRDTAQKLVVPRLKQLVKILIVLSEQNAETVQIGRTHGQHALPITFGFALAEYVERLGQSMQAIEALSKELTGKFSGAVGSYNALSVFVQDPIKFEKTLLAKLDLNPAPYSNQIVPPESGIRLIDELVIAAGTMANLSHDMRHLQRSEIAEIREKFEKGQTGSSTMAHKRNPWNFENVISMCKQVFAQSINANLNISSEHQRDLTDSASSRFYPIAFAGVASMAERLTRVMQKIEIDKDNMQKNLVLTSGAIAAEPLYLLLAKHGHTQAHEKARTLAHGAMEQEISLVEAIEQDKDAHQYWQQLRKKEQRIIVEPEKYYTGLATKKTKIICNKWKKLL